MPHPTTVGGVRSVGEIFADRIGPGRALADDSARLAEACHRLAQRFQQGGRLLVFGMGTAATDAQHIAVEFVHPVIVGKRALPALALTNDVATVTGISVAEGPAEVFAHQLHQLARPDDIALGVAVDGHCAAVLRGLEVASARGLLTMALVGGADAERGGGALATSPAVDHLLRARSDDPRVVKELQVTTYHVLWELVHVFLEHPGIFEPEVVR